MESGWGSESRSFYTPSYTPRRNYVSESGYASESNYAAESYTPSVVRVTSNANSTTKPIKDLKEIDALISRLERSMPKGSTSNPKINQAIVEKKNKIEELKKLVEVAKRQKEEEKTLTKIEEENRQLDEAIKFINSLRGH